MLPGEDTCRTLLNLRAACDVMNDPGVQSLKSLLLIDIPVFVLSLVPVLLIVLGPSFRSGLEINPASHLNSLDAKVLDFDIIIDGKWRFSASRRSGEVRIVPPFDVSFEPTGVLLEHADDWSIELGGHELGWGDSFD